MVFTPDRPFETERLVVRTYTPEDSAAYFAMYTNPQVMRFLPGVEIESLDKAREAIQRIADKYRGSPYGGWALEHKATREIVGTVLLKNLPGSEKIEVGWHLTPAHWGYGFATEAGAGALKYGFDQLGLDTIYAVADPDNVKSLNVMRRLGMTHKGLTDEYYGLKLEIYEIQRSNANWRA